MTSRLFAAVVPPPAVIEHLAEFAESRRSRDDPLHWTDEQRWHLTLAFMPAAHDDRYEDFGDRLQAAAAKRARFELQIAGAGTFGDPSRAKVLWAGVAGAVDELTRLATGVRNAASTAGIAVDGAQFRPHVTLARMNPPIEATRWLRVFDTYTGPRWQVDEFQLIESRIGRRGGSTHAEHDVRDVFRLA